MSEVIEHLKSKNAAMERQVNFYQSLIQRMHRGYAVHELIYDEENTPIDYRFLETNAAFEKITGLKDVIGKTLREVIPEPENVWIERYGKLIEGEESEHFEQYDSVLKRYFEVWAYSPEKGYFVAIFADITERKRTEKQLDSALERVKTLSGLLPICSYCKKIRNDAGEWEDVAEYIRNHSEAIFSHGICDECTQIHFPNHSSVDNT